MSELTQLLISQLLKQKLAEPQLQREREERAAELAQQREWQLAQKSVEMGATSKDLMKMRGMFSNLEPSILDGIGVMGDLRAKKAKEEKQLTELTDPQQLQQLALQASSRPNATGGTSDPRDAIGPGGASTNNVGDLLAMRIRDTAAIDPDMVPGLLSRFGTELGAANRSTDVSVAKENLDQLRTIQSEVRGEARGERVARRSAYLAEETRVVDASAARIAYAAFGLADEIPGVRLGDPKGSRDEVSQILQDRGLPKGIADKRASEALGKADRVYVELKKWEKDANGKGVDTKFVEARLGQLQDTYEAEILPDRKTMDNLLLEAQDRSVEDPVGIYRGELRWLNAGGKDDAKRLRAARRDFVDLLDKSKGLTEALDAIDVARKEGRMSGGAGAFEGLYDLAAFSGEDVSEVQTYRAASFTYASSLLRAVQGGRFSDKDLAMQLMVFPALYELGGPNQRRKIEAMQRTLQRQEMAPLSPKQRRAMQQEMDDFKPPPFSSEMQSLLQRVKTGEVSINDPEVQSQFLKEADAWASRPDVYDTLTKQNQRIGRVSPGNSKNLDDFLGSP